MEGRAAGPGRVLEQFVVSVHARSGKHFVPAIGGEDVGEQQAPAPANGGDRSALIGLALQIAKRDGGRYPRIPPTGFHAPPAFRAPLPSAPCPPGIAVAAV